VIESFGHRGIQRFFETGSKAGIRADHAERLRLVLGRLNAAIAPKDMDLPGLRLHRLKGSMKDRWSVTVSANRRITFAFLGKNAILVDYEDYH
jgi:proteic killer suppression protein